jgi:LL-diaminopimelate aminotransferase
MGSTGSHNGTGFDGITYMECRPENDFFPDLGNAPRTDIIFFCSPNNPTGAAATREQLTKLVEFARNNGSIIVYDAAYALYISDPNCPKTIYEIPGAEECAIETCSFSKYAGFTGVRLGWTVVPEQLRYADGSPVLQDFNRIMTTVFNGASNIAQAGGLACLQDKGWEQMLELVAFYRENAAILRKTFQEMGFTVYGGENAPYVWVGFPGQKSWDVFAEILEKCDIVTTPGSGFGPAGEGFVRASAFGHRDTILEAVQRFKNVYGGGNNN